MIITNHCIRSYYPIIVCLLFFQVFLFSCSGPVPNDQVEAGGKRFTGAIQSANISSSSPDLLSTARNETPAKTDSLFLSGMLQKAKDLSILGHSDSAGFIYSDLILELARRGDTIGLATINSKLVYAFLRQNNFSLARLSSIKALQYGGIDSAGWCQMLSAIGDAAFEKGDYPVAVKNYEEALRVIKRLNLQEKIGPEKIKLARTLSKMGDFNQSNLYTERAINSFLRYGDSVNLAECYCLKVNNLQRTNQDSSEYYLNLMLNIFQKMADSSKIVEVLYEKAILYTENQPEQAKPLFLHSLGYYQRNNNTPCEIMCLHQLGILNTRQQKFDEALSLLGKANQMADDADLIPLKVPLLLSLSAVLQETGDHRRAYATIVQANQIRDSLGLTQEDLTSLIKSSGNPDFATISQPRNLPKEEKGSWFAIRLHLIILLLICLLTALAITIYRKYMYSKLAGLIPTVDKEVFPCSMHPMLTATRRLTFRVQENQPSRFGSEDLDLKISTLVLERQIFRNRLLSSELFAREAGINHRQLSSYIKQRYGLTYPQFIRQQRVEYARKLLSEMGNEEFKIDMVSFQSGFNNRQSFYEAFTKIVGISPGEYRKNALKSS